MSKKTPVLTDANTTSRFHMARLDWPTPDRVCNSTMANVPHEQARATFGWFTPPARAGAEDALRYRSLGAGC